ncbi:MAG: AAA family ATPase [Methyloprofundus sp.]|nr:AAA family ATPase [Methyloprofundus sp.]
MSEYHNDQPIKGDDLSPDLLNRSKFAENLAEVLTLKSTDECLTVSLEGVWGYGKTSTINLVKSHLQRQRAIEQVVFEYNPWLIGDADLLVQDFLRQLASNLHIHFSADKGLEVANELLTYSNLFGVIKLIPGAEPWASLAETVISKVGTATEKISKLKELDVLGKKQKISDLLAQLNVSIVVIIDDIDRLTPREAFEVLRLVKAVADFKGTAFLLAFDPKYLHSVLQSHAISNAEEYLDKIVQLRVSLPLIAEKDLEKVTQNELASLSKDDLTKAFDDEDQLSNIYHFYYRSLIASPRDVKRFFNHLRFVESQVRGQVAFSNLFGLSLLAMKAPNIYELLKERPDYFVGRGFERGFTPESFSEKQKDKSKVVINAELEKIPNPKNQYVVDRLLKELFDHPRDSTSDANGLVSVYSRLYIALHYQAPTGYVTDMEVEDFIYGSIDRSKFLHEVFKREAMQRFFELMFQNAELCNGNTKEILVAINDAFLTHPQTVELLRNFTGFMDFNPLQQLIAINKELLFKDESIAILLELVEIESYAPIYSDLVRTLMAEKEDVPIDIEQLKSKFSLAAMKCLEEKIYQGTLLESQVFYGLRVTDEKAVIGYFHQLLNSENGVIRIAEILGSTGSDTTAGAYFKFERNFLGSEFDIELLKQKAGEALQLNAELNIEVQAVLKAICEEDTYYLSNLKKADWL